MSREQMRMADDFEDHEELFAEMFGLPPLLTPERGCPWIRRRPCGG
jgi:hypothetical protein